MGAKGPGRAGMDSLDGIGWDPMGWDGMTKAHRARAYLRCTSHKCALKTMRCGEPGRDGRTGEGLELNAEDIVALATNAISRRRRRRQE